jgi:dimethylglycine dehydrogenase
VKTETRAVVIGGGIVGCSILYHLSKLGWHDVMLLERTELTSGSTWHAAGGMHTLNGDPIMAALQKYTIDQYKEIEKISGQACGLHQVGELYLATNPDRMDFLKAEQAKSVYLDIDSRMLTVDEVLELNPLLNPDGILGAMYDASDGHMDPTGVTTAYAKAARLAGAEVHRHTPVTETQRLPDGGWLVKTPRGEIRCEVVINAGGLWGREVAAMAGVTLPIVPIEHMYLVTDSVPEIEALTRELPYTIDFDAESYMRQEGQGFLIGTYEQQCKHWAVGGTSADFGHELLEPDLERLMDRLSVAFERVPALRSAGIKQVVNGPIVFAPDGNPVIGPMPGLPGYFVACGVMAGCSQGGGIGLAIAEWIVEGEPGRDVFAMDVARFGDWATKAYVLDKTYENYGRRFKITFPNEELPAARPLLTSPVYDLMKERNAVFGASYGKEYALWFAPEGVEPYETPTFRRSEAFAHVADECRAVRENVGISEIATFGKYEVEGPGADRWLDGVLAGTMPTLGKMKLLPMLSPKGRLAGDFTVSRLAEEKFMIIGSGVAQQFHTRWFLKNMPEQGVSLRTITDERPGFSIAGPKARALLKTLCEADVSNEAFPFMNVRELNLGAIRARVCRISFTGELGYEIYARSEDHRALMLLLEKAGAPFGLKHFGGRAFDSLRLEKGFGAWTSLDFSPDYTAVESGMSRFVSADKTSYIGRSAFLQHQDEGAKRRLVLLEIDALDADALGNEPVLYQGRCIGHVTSGGYGHYTQKSVALGYIETAYCNEGQPIFVSILGDARPARVRLSALHDPEGTRMRS